MTQFPLRLVVDRGDEVSPSTTEPCLSAGNALHIHLHVGPQSDRPPIPGTAELRGADNGRTGKGRVKPLLLGMAGVLIAVVAFDFGARSGAGHARALAASAASAAGLASLAAMPTPPAAPGALPAIVQQQLAQRPTMTLPAGADARAGAPDPFGLQH